MATISNDKLFVEIGKAGKKIALHIEAEGESAECYIRWDDEAEGVKLSCDYPDSWTYGIEGGEDVGWDEEEDDEYEGD